MQMAVMKKNKLKEAHLPQYDQGVPRVTLIMIPSIYLCCPIFKMLSISFAEIEGLSPLLSR